MLPVYNEEGNLMPLTEELVTVLDENYGEWEIIFVDDGSIDGSWKVLKKLKQVFNGLKLVKFRRNYGQTQAIQAGLEKATGDYVVTMDSDMQNDPADIPRLESVLKERNADMVNGWRKNRKDPLIKKLFSNFAARLRKFLIDTDLNDYGCTLRIMTLECAKNISMKGELHRYIPPLVEMDGYYVAEAEVNHRPRRSGNSRYSFLRIPKGFIDLINIWLRKRYRRRILHIFGGLGLLSIGVGFILMLVAFFQKIEGTSLSDTGATVLSALFIIMGIQLFVSGFISDIIIKNLDHKDYVVDDWVE